MSKGKYLTPQTAAKLERILDAVPPAVVGNAKGGGVRQVGFVYINTANGDGTYLASVECWDTQIGGWETFADVKVREANGVELVPERRYLGVRSGEEGGISGQITFVVYAGCKIDLEYVEDVEFSSASCGFTATVTFGKLECPEPDPPGEPTAPSTFTFTIPTTTITYVSDVSASCSGGTVTVTKTTATAKVLNCP